MVHSFFDLSAASTMYLWGTLQSAGVPRAGDPPIGEMMAAVEMLTATTSSLALMLSSSAAGKLEGMVTVMSQVPLSVSIWHMRDTVSGRSSHSIF